MAGTPSLSLAAITTVFTPPCPITWILTSTKVPSQYPPFPTAAPAACDPPSWDAYLSQRGFAYYSPAICPSGFYIGPSCIIDTPRIGEGFPAIQPGETAAYCVPSGHTCTSDVTDFRGGVWGVTRTAAVTGAQATVGPAIQIRWRAGDLDVLETDPLTPGLRFMTTSLISTSISTSSSSSSLPAGPTITVAINSPVVPKPSPSLKTSTIYSTTSSLSSSPSDSITTTPSAFPSDLSPTGPPAKSQDTPDRTQKGQDSSGSSTFTTATIVLTAILITILAAYGAWAMLKRYRRYRAGETTGTETESGPELFVFQVEAWVRRLLLRLNKNKTTTDDDGLEDEDEGKGRPRRKLPDAELGTNGPLPELADTKPFGTKENPAELPSATTTQERISGWRERVTRMSRLFTKHMSAP